MLLKYLGFLLYGKMIKAITHIQLFHYFYISISLLLWLYENTRIWSAPRVGRILYLSISIQSIHSCIVQLCAALFFRVFNFDSCSSLCCFRLSFRQRNARRYMDAAKEWRLELDTSTLTRTLWCFCDAELMRFGRWEWAHQRYCDDLAGWWRALWSVDGYE